MVPERASGRVGIIPPTPTHQPTQAPYSPLGNTTGPPYSSYGARASKWASWHHSTPPTHQLLKHHTLPWAIPPAPLFELRCSSEQVGELASLPPTHQLLKHHTPPWAIPPAHPFSPAQPPTQSPTPRADPPPLPREHAHLPPPIPLPPLHRPPLADAGHHPRGGPTRGGAARPRAGRVGRRSRWERVGC
jgi:hypothetical protein